MPHSYCWEKFCPATLVEVLEWRARNESSRIAYTFCEDGENEDESVTYAELDNRARKTSAWLQQVVRRADRVLLILPPGLDYIVAFMGCLYAGVIAVPTYPPNPVRLRDAESRFRAIVRDAQPALGLTTSRIFEALRLLSKADPEIAAVRWEPVSAIDASPDEWTRPSVDGATVAFLQYTSGSTSTPKGVMVSHGSLLSNEQGIQRACGHTSDSTFVGWLPFYHDMGLIGNVLQPLFIGARSILMPPTAFLQKPLRWLQAISKYRAATSGGPNFAYDLCVQRASDSDLLTLDLSTWSVAFNGAEPVRDGTLKRFTERFAPCGFHLEAFFPCYGLAEATLMVSGGPKGAKPAISVLSADALENGCAVPCSEEIGKSRRLVGCGSAIHGQEILIVKPGTRGRCGCAEIGEIWVAGSSVADGYWCRPEESEETFRASLACEDERRWLRTGDLGFLDDNGTLFISGRIKDLIILRGKNYYPNDIELTAEQSSILLRRSGSAAFAITIHEEEAVVIVQEVERIALHQANDLVEIIRRAIAAEHGIQMHSVILVKPGGIPKTTSGKVQRSACRKAFLEGDLPVIAVGVFESHEVAAGAERRYLRDLLAAPLQHRSALIDVYLVETVARVLRRTSASVKLDLTLVQLGLDSLSAVELKNTVHDELSVSIPFSSLLGTERLSDLAGIVFDALAQPSTAQLPLVDTDLLSHPLTYGQRALWYLHQLAPDSPAYNISGVFALGSGTDVPALRRSCELLVQSHACLRSVFLSQNGEPRQHVHAVSREFFVEHDALKWDDMVLQKRINVEADRPFNLERGPLMRVNIFTRPGGDCVLQFVLHHLIADFWSVELILEELGSVYSSETGSTPPERSLAIAPYNEWQRLQVEMLTGPEGERLRNYWQRQLASPSNSDNRTLELPLSYQRPAIQLGRTGFHGFHVDSKLHLRLVNVSGRYGVTRFTLFAAVFELLLHRWSGEIHVRIGCPMACRQDARFSRTVGYFANTVVLNADFSGSPAFSRFLAGFRNTVLEALQHQEYPFSLLVETLQPTRDASQPPLVPAMLVWQKAQLTREWALAVPGVSTGAKMTLGALEMEPLELVQRGTPTDITLTMAETPSGVSALLTYNADLFSPETIGHVADWFVRLLEGIAENPETPISNLAFLSPVEVERQVIEWNRTMSLVPSTALHELVEAQAAVGPQTTAVSFEGKKLNYAELNCTANRLARCLKQRGVGAGAVIGVSCERSLELAVILLAVLKAGAAYLPLEPEYPDERLCSMVTQSQAQFVIGAPGVESRLAGQPCRVLDTNELFRESEFQSGENLGVHVSSDDPAYVIFTSGSTGRPKGAMNTHRGIVNRLLWMQDRFQCDSTDVVLHKTPLSFDVSVWELFWPLIAGSRLLVAASGGHRDPSYLANLIKSEQVTTIHFVPSMLRAFVDTDVLAGCPSLRRVISSGESLPLELQKDFFAQSNAQLYNLYGPTEAAIDVTAWECLRSQVGDTVPIGKPITNLRTYVLDRYLEPRPAGATGKLYIAGHGLALGYIGSTELTGEKFIPDPFSIEAGGRLYDTGDLARYRSDGVIEFLGRNDSQIKIRGFRVELGEIEAAIRSAPKVRDCAVIVEQAAPEDQRLVAYVVFTGSADALRSELCAHLARSLPAYMVPGTFVKLESMPVTANGKIDRRALPPSESSMDAHDESPMPLSPIEQILSGLWASVLDGRKPRKNDSFFDLGGHSLLAIRLLSMIRDTFAVDVPLATFFASEPTLARVAEMIEDLIIENADPSLLERAFTEMKGLPEQ